MLHRWSCLSTRYEGFFYHTMNNESLKPTNVADSKCHISWVSGAANIVDHSFKQLGVGQKFILCCFASCVHQKCNGVSDENSSHTTVSSAVHNVCLKTVRFTASTTNVAISAKYRVSTSLTILARYHTQTAHSPCHFCSSFVP